MLYIIYYVYYIDRERYRYIDMLVARSVRDPVQFGFLSTRRRNRTHMLLYYSTLCYTIPYYTILHYTTLHYTTLHYTTLHYTTLHYTTLHYATP